MACCRRCRPPSSGSPGSSSPIRPTPPGGPSPTSPTAAETSEATVIRFCRSVGLDGYPQLRIRLAAEAARRVEPPDARVVGGDIPPGADLAQIIATIAFNDARAVEETAEQLDPEVCEQVVEAINAASRIDIYGAGASGFVASDFQQKLHRIGRTAYYWPDVHTALTSAALLGKGDVAIGISHTGTTADVIEVLEQARARGATTVALTNFPRSPIAEVADLVLTTAARETTYRSGAMASRLAQLTVVDCLFVGVAARNRAKARKALEVTAEAVRARPGRRGGAGERARGGPRPGGAPTERRNPCSVDLDLMSDRDVLRLINDADRRCRPRWRRCSTRSRPPSTWRSTRCAPGAGCTTSAPAPPAGSAWSTPPRCRRPSARRWTGSARTWPAGPTPCGGAIEDAEDDERRRRRGGARPACGRGPGDRSGGHRAYALVLGALRAARAWVRAPRWSRPTRTPRRRRGRRVHRRRHRPRGGHRLDPDEGRECAEAGAATPSPRR